MYVHNPWQYDPCIMMTSQVQYSLYTGTLVGDTVSMLTHAYPHKPPRKIKVTMCNHQAENPLYVWLAV